MTDRDSSQATAPPALTTWLAERGLVTPGPRPADVTVLVARVAELPVLAAELTTNFGLALGMILATDDDPRLGVHYVFEPTAPGDDRFVTLRVELAAEQLEVPSLTPVLPAANWHEREARDLFGVVPVGHPDPRPLVLHEGWPPGLFPLRKRFEASERPPHEPAPTRPLMLARGEGVFEIPVGPIHAGIIEPGHFRFSSVGETVLHLDAQLFFTHRGLEKRVEGLAPADAFVIVERICGVCSVAHGLGFCEAVEQVCDLEVPARARMLRTAALELERLYNHVGDVGNLCAGMGFHYGTAVGARLREALQQLNETLTGHRFLRGLLQPGGVRLDLTAPLARALDEHLAALGPAFDDLMSRIEGSPSVLDRIDGTGVLTAKAAGDLAICGVAARASGIDRDARRDHPHAAYAHEFAGELRVVTATGGDVHARLSVRAGELRESLRLTRALLAGLSPGPLAVAVPDTMPPGRVGLVAIESPRGSALHWLRADDAGRIDRYHLRSPSYANWPAVALAAESAIVPDFPLVNKSFELCYSCTDR